jgi:putative ABC transport system ATP-binding protein
VADPIVRARGVAKVYRGEGVETPALRDVDLDVVRGEMLAIMGPSGCGKTTLLNCLAGLDTLDGGTVEVEGVVLAARSDRERTLHRAKRMGFVFQSFNLLPVLTAAENVEVPLLVTGVAPDESRRRAREALAAVGIADRADHRPAELSGGQQQRVTIARSLVNDPAIVWADEPTGNLDTATGRDVFALMRRLNQERGQTYVVVTHDPGIAALCDRTVHMESGRIAREERSP